MSLIQIILSVVTLVTGVALVGLVLMHKGRGGGISDMFGGGMSSSLGGSSVAERNLTRLTVGVAVIWVVCVVAIGLVLRFGI